MDTDSYWRGRGAGYKAEFKRHNPLTRFRFWQQERAIRRELKALEGVERILEVGCGFGRITKLLLELPDVKRIVATDISEDQIKAAKRTIKDPRVEFRCISVLDLDYSKEFDLVIASEVLMHIPPDRIMRAIRRMEAASKKHIMNIDWYALDEPHEAGGYCWQHDYSAAYPEETRIKKLHRQAIWIGTI